MYTRRKNGEQARPKRVSKRSKICEILSSVYVQQIKVIMLWVCFLIIDHSSGMRMEYLWPSWLFLCSINESLRFEGLHFSLVFVLIVLASDLIFFLVVPVNWAFLLGSAYAWIYLLWHIERGFCLPTCMLFAIFMLFELKFRVTNWTAASSSESHHKQFSNGIYLFRPFATHCIGYPAVCVSFSVKNYFEFKYRTRKKLDVRAQNEMYYRLLDDALYPKVYPIKSNGMYTRPLYDDYDEKRAFNEIKMTSASSCYLNGELEYRSSTLDNNSFAAILFYPFTCPSGNIFDSNHVIWRFCSFISHLPIIRAFFLFVRRSPTTTLTNLNNSSPVTLSPAQSLDNLVENVHTQQNSSSSNTLEFSTSTPSAGASSLFEATGDDPGFQPCSFDGYNSSQQKAAPTAINNHNTSSSGGNKEIDVNSKLTATIKKLRGDIMSIKAAETQLQLQVNQLDTEISQNSEACLSKKADNELLSQRISKLASTNKGDRGQMSQVESHINEELRMQKDIRDKIKRIEDAVQNAPEPDSSMCETSMSVTTAAPQTPASSASRGGKQQQQQAKTLTSIGTFDPACAYGLPGPNGQVVVSGAVQCICGTEECPGGNPSNCSKRRKRLEQDLRSLSNQLKQRDDKLRSLGKKQQQLQHQQQNTWKQPIEMMAASSSKECYIQGEASIQSAREEQIMLSSKIGQERSNIEQIQNFWIKALKDADDLNKRIKDRESYILNLTQSVKQCERLLNDAKKCAVSSTRHFFGGSNGKPALNKVSAAVSPPPMTSWKMGYFDGGTQPQQKPTRKNSTGSPNDCSPYYNGSSTLLSSFGGKGSGLFDPEMQGLWPIGKISTASTNNNNNNSPVYDAIMTTGSSTSPTTVNGFSPVCSQLKPNNNKNSSSIIMNNIVTPVGSVGELVKGLTSSASSSSSSN